MDILFICVVLVTSQEPSSTHPLSHYMDVNIRILCFRKMSMPQTKEGSRLLDSTNDCKQGMSMVLLPAVLHDLSRHLKMSYTQLSIANSMASVGAIFGSITGGFLTKRLSNHLDLALFTVFIMITMALMSIPFTTHVVLQSLEWFVQGWAMAVGNIVNIMVVVRIWPENVGSMVLLVSAANSVGHIAGFLLPIPFVSNDNSEKNFSPLVCVPFIILAGVFVANAVNLLIQHAVGLRCHKCFDSVSSSDTNERQLDPKSPSQLLWLVVPGMGMVDIFVRASDMIPAYLAPSIGIESRLHMPASQSDLVNAMYGISRMISKLVTSFLLKRVSVMLCLPTCIVMTSVAALFLFLIGLNSVSSFFTTMIIIGLFTGPPGALLLVWVSEYVTVDNYVVSLWQVAENIGNLSGVLVGGVVFDIYGPLLSLFVNLINDIIACIGFFVLQCLITIRQPNSLSS
ncbi:hypothetical protein CAPTEDRAFT_216242 [Capitella teleta]|uniref:Major facilitator superfamily (MFS) profile domain-containing protein n=1 Tax=Capitella teleta TaxID=283909 RepID=R7TV98_CAPTE|nr:hypothetical protein CAPTEDRAFT_216242 [Capitella teleta]|eukprot:ELT94940.1 hypothetical protein CAPTEDRAFT_216242 [Capitella teleta]